MHVEIIETKDGSHSLYSVEFDEVYHSRHGALAESQHIFITNGLETIDKQEINIFELGFGTGLNALLACIYAESKGIKINYHSIEFYPIPSEVYTKINYPELIGSKEKFQQLHDVSWNETVELSPHFSLHKIHASIIDINLDLSPIDMIFFDAFSPEKQPDMWTTDLFTKVYNILTPGGILVTYCSKSYVRKNMQQVGFQIRKIPGPHGKRDMVLATKPI